MEVDVLGKYVAKMLSAYTQDKKSGGISEDFLKEHGF
jgi:hypothetical protein